MPPALVILAAGASARLGEPKALVDLGGRSALERLVEASRAFGTPLVIAGAHFDRIRALAPPGCLVVENPDWRAGRTGTAALGAAMRAGCDLCLAPIDAPLVPAAVFEALARAWREAGEPPRGWLAPRFGDRHGHPILVGRELAAALGSMPESEPLRALRGHAEPLFAVDVQAPEVLDDLDTPEDLGRLRARLSP
jgi:molybdenum cofactor cytidylyltransferase